MADSLPLIKACMADVKSGKYTNSPAALTAAGAKLQSSTDPATGQPVKIVVKNTPVVAKNTSVSLSASDASKKNATTAAAPAATAAAAPAAAATTAAAKKEAIDDISYVESDD